MPEQWTGDLICKMHLNGVKRKEIAHKLGYNEKYVLAVLNGKATPKGAQQRFEAAVDAIIAERSAQNV